MYQITASVTTNITATSDYIWRGQTQTEHEAALQGGLDYEHKSGLSAGTWLSNVAGGQTEADFFAKYTFAVNDKVKLSLGKTFYHYTHSGTSDSLEYNFGLSLWMFDLGVNYMDDYFGSDSSSIYYQASTGFEICKENQLKLNLAVGFTTFDTENKTGSSDYLDYKIALTKKVDSREFEIFYTDTDRKTSANSGSIEQDDHSFGISLTQSI